VADVRRAVHIRTGPRASVDAIDAWLTAHGVEIVPFNDVYASCVHLLTCYEHIPDLVLVGTDWLAGDELAIVSYVRQTWPRCGIIIYGDAESPAVELLPLVLTCRGPTALGALLARGPDELVRRLSEQLRPLVLGAATAADASRPSADISGSPALLERPDEA
jgi:hypothetical protein